MRHVIGRNGSRLLKGNHLHVRKTAENRCRLMHLRIMRGVRLACLGRTDNQGQADGLELSVQIPDAVLLFARGQSRQRDKHRQAQKDM